MNLGTNGTLQTLINEGIVDAYATGIGNIGIISGINNIGSIIANLYGINNAKTIGNINNSGLISGSYGVINNNGVIGSLSNSGTISGYHSAIYSYGSLGTITNSGVIAGNVIILGQDLIIAGGSSNYGTFTASANNFPLTIPNIGTIITSGNVSIIGGNVLLNDHVNLNAGAGTLVNAGNLQVIAPISITGSYYQANLGSLVLGASSASLYGKLNVSGAASMANAQLVLNAIGSFAPSLGETFTLVSALSPGTSYAGDSITVNFNGYDGVLSTSVSGSASNLILTLAAGSSSSSRTFLASSLGNTANTAIAGGTLQLNQAGQTYSNGFTLDTSSSNILDTAGNNSTLSGVLSNASAGQAGNIIFANSGSGGGVILTGVNTYTGSTTVNAGATVALAGAGSVAASSGVTANGTVDVSGITASSTTITSLSGSGAVALGGKTLALSQASGGFSGTIAGTGGVALISGTETLSGANSYSGGTSLGSGSVIVAGNSAALGSGAVQMAVGSGVSFASGGNYALANNFVLTGDPTFTTPAGQTDTITGVLSDGSLPGIVEVAGGGALVLSAINSYSGGTTIESGSTLQIASGGQIGTGLIYNAGTLQLSSAQTITGIYTQVNTGTLAITAASAASYGQIVTSAAATMPNATLSFATTNGYAPATGSKFVLVSASSASTYASDSITTNLVNYLSNLVTINSGATSNLVLEVQKVPTIYADTMRVQRASFLDAASAVDQQMQSTRGAKLLASNDAAVAMGGNNIWLSASGQFITAAAAGGAPGYNAENGGAVVGIDHVFAEALRAGVAIDAAQQSIGGGSGTTYTGQAEQIELYATAQHDRFFVDAQIAGLFSQGTAKRSMASASAASGNVNGSGYGGATRFGLRQEIGGWALEPGLTFAGMSLTQGALSESNAGAFDLAISKGALASFTVMPGVEADRSFDLAPGYRLTSAGKLGWRHEMMDTRTALSAALSGASTSFASAPIARDALETGFNLELQTPAAIRVFARYQADLDSRSQTQSAQGGVKLNW